MTERLHFHFHTLQKEMATHASILAWRIPGMGEPGGLPSMGSHRVGHDWSDLAAAGSFDCFETGKHFRYLVGRDQKCQPSCNAHESPTQQKLSCSKCQQSPYQETLEYRKEDRYMHTKNWTPALNAGICFTLTWEKICTIGTLAKEKKWRGWATMCTFTDV